MRATLVIDTKEAADEIEHAMFMAGFLLRPTRDGAYIVARIPEWVRDSGRKSAIDTTRRVLPVDKFAKRLRDADAPDLRPALDRVF